MTSQLLLGIGGAHVDRRGRALKPFVFGVSNPGTMHEEVGGGVLNALRAARFQDVSAAILSVRGGDAAGETVEKAIAIAGITDLSAVFLDRSTPSYTAILDESGDVVAALADMQLYEATFERQLRRLGFREAVAQAHTLLVDANLPEGALTAMIRASSGKVVHAMAISPAKAIRLRPHLGQLSGLYMNAREALVLSGQADAPAAAKWFLEQGVSLGAITNGSGAVIGFEADGVFSLLPPTPERILDVTGAGDALAGTVVACLMSGTPLRTALRAGLAAASLTVESEGAAPVFERLAFEERLALVPEAEGVA